MASARALSSGTGKPGLPMMRVIRIVLAITASRLVSAGFWSSASSCLGPGGGSRARLLEEKITPRERVRAACRAAKT